MGYISDSDVVFVCNATEESSFDKAALFLLKEKNKALKIHCQSNANFYMDQIQQQLEKWLVHKNKNKWKVAWSSMPHTAKKNEFDRILLQKNYDLSSCTWNGSGTQQYMIFDLEELENVFGDKILKNIKRPNCSFYILSIAQMKITYYVKKNHNNMKIEAYVKKNTIT